MKTLLHTIKDLAGRLKRDVRFMEVCGTHTMVAFRTGLVQLLPPNVKLISGPGCPVCVTDTSYIDAAINLCRRPNVIIATFGDLLRVPGSESSLERERASGAQVRIVYSPMDAVNFAQEAPGKHVVFLGVGFETTAPTVAWSIRKADREGTKNFSVLCAHKTMPHAMAALLKDKQVGIDGFICPGHVSVITGAAMYRFLCAQYDIPCVVTGFEAWDMLKAVAMLLQQRVDGRAMVEVEYSRSVTERGNTAAQELIHEVFEPCDVNWRGLGTIPQSGLAIRAKYGRFDAARVLNVQFGEAQVPAGCHCGEVLRGVLTPLECRLFGRVCSPMNPIGPCMVSSEGVCAAYYKYEKRAA